METRSVFTASTRLLTGSAGIKGESACSSVMVMSADYGGMGAGDVALDLCKKVCALSFMHRMTFEVKASRFSDWKKYGRSLDAAQFARTTADAYVWAVVADSLPTTSVILMGWLPTSEITAPTTTGVALHGRPHLRVKVPMRPMGAMSTWWDAQEAAIEPW